MTFLQNNVLTKVLLCLQLIVSIQCFSSTSSSLHHRTPIHSLTSISTSSQLLLSPSRYRHRRLFGTSSPNDVIETDQNNENDVVDVKQQQQQQQQNSTVSSVTESTTTSTTSTTSTSGFNRFQACLPQKDELDTTILRTAIPSMINLAVVPIVNSVDTYFVGQCGVALALAGQAAANQAFFTLFFLVNYVPTITAPLVAAAVGSGNTDDARDRVTESLFVSMCLGGIGTVLLCVVPTVSLQLVLNSAAPAMEYAAPYLRIRALSMIPSLISATGFAAYRGMLDTVTPLKVSLATNVMNLILDPLLIGTTSLGFVGAAAATAISETFGGLVYMKLLLKKKLTNLKTLLLKPPSLKALAPLLSGGLTMLGRQAVLNLSFVFAARRAQAMDPTGVSAAAYGIVMQIYSLGIVLQLAMQGTAASLVPSVLAKTGGNTNEARKVADRTFCWGALLGGFLGVAQLVALPWIVPLFSTLPEVQAAVKAPAVLASMLHVINGFCFAGEGVLLGLQRYKDLMLITAGSAASMVACLGSPLGAQLDGIMWSIMAFTGVQAVGVVVHYLKIGPLAVKRARKNGNNGGDGASSVMAAAV